MISRSNRIYNLIRISAAFGAGSGKAVNICKELYKEGSLDLSPDLLLNSRVFDEKSRDRVAAVDNSKIEAVFKDCKREEIEIVTLFDAGYPERLKNITPPPLLLFIKGNFPDIDGNPVFCIVGPRRISEFGKKAAYALSRRLSKAGMTVVTGAAAGSDTAVHSGAVSVNACSVMVTADGISTQLKSSSHELCAKVLRHGCIISENPPSYVANKFSFPVRNRIMSGLSVGVAVVEAPKQSGALITASHAADQGRDVFVIPGNPTDKNYEGSNALLRDGATPLLDASDIFARFIPLFPDKIDVKKAFSGDSGASGKKTRKKSTENLSKEALLVYNNLVKPEFTVDDLYTTGLDGSVLLSALTELEMEHFISPLPGGLYRIKD